MNKTEKFIQLSRLIKESDGKFFSVSFTKKDGSNREMICRYGVGRYVKGEGLKFDPEKKGMIVVWEPQKNRPGEESYRLLNLNSVKQIRINGQQLTFKE